MSSSIPSDHIDMCKFQSNTDIGYRRVRSQLRDLLEPEHPEGMQESRSSNIGSNARTAGGRTPFILERAPAPGTLQAQLEGVD